MIRPRGMTVVCYTGFTLHELRSKHRADIDRFLESVDILIDGRFVRDLAAPLRWRGSRNQQIHFLSEAYRHLEDSSDDMSRIEFLVSQNEFTTTGVWPEDFLQQVILALSGNQE